MSVLGGVGLVVGTCGAVIAATTASSYYWSRVEDPRPFSFNRSDDDDDDDGDGHYPRHRRRFVPITLLRFLSTAGNGSGSPKQQTGDGGPLSPLPRSYGDDGDVSLSQLAADRDSFSIELTSSRSERRQRKTTKRSRRAEGDAAENDVVGATARQVSSPRHYDDVLLTSGPSPPATVVPCAAAAARLGGGGGTHHDDDDASHPSAAVPLPTLVGPPSSSRDVRVATTRATRGNRRGSVGPARGGRAPSSSTGAETLVPPTADGDSEEDEGYAGEKGFNPLQFDTPISASNCADNDAVGGGDSDVRNLFSPSSVPNMGGAVSPLPTSSRGMGMMAAADFPRFDLLSTVDEDLDGNVFAPINAVAATAAAVETLVAPHTTTVPNNSDGFLMDMLVHDGHAFGNSEYLFHHRRYNNHNNPSSFLHHRHRYVFAAATQSYHSDHYRIVDGARSAMFDSFRSGGGRVNQLSSHGGTLV